MVINPDWPKFRLALDRPYDFAIEPGIVRATHCHDFRDDAISLKEGAFRCPVTGLVMLTPSWLSEDHQTTFEPTANWTKEESLWKEVQRVHDKYSAAAGAGLLSAPMLSSSYPATSMGGVISWGGSLGAVAVAQLLSLIEGDELEWALTSDFTLYEDEGFVLHLNQSTDSQRRHKNGVVIQWDNLQVHIRPSGVMALYRWEDREDMSDSATLKLVEEYQMSSPGEMHGRDSYVMFLPVPTYGLLVYHSYTPQRLSSKLSSARAGSVRGHLFSLPEEERPDSAGNFRLTRASIVRIGLTKSTRVAHTIGFHRLRFPSAGSYLDAIYSPPYRPTNAPDQCDPITISTGRTTPSASFRKTDDSGDFAGADRQGRVKVIMTSSGSSVYTPFLLGTYVRWNPVFAARDTKPLELTPHGGRWNDLGEGAKDTQDFLQHLEFTETDEARFEGKARVWVSSEEGKALLERGDATWEIERQDEAEGEWHSVCGGIARWESESVKAIPYDAGDDDNLGFGEGTRRRIAYSASLSLWDGFHRFSEVHQCNQSAFDRLTIHQSIDTVLMASGQPALSGTIPTRLDEVALPAVPKGENWRHGTQEGDEGDVILRQLLLYPRKQWLQYRLINHWRESTWTVEEYRRLAGAEDPHWWFTPDRAEAYGSDNPEGAPDPAFRIEYGVQEGGDSLYTLRVYPPEATHVKAWGLEQAGPEGKRIGSWPFVNQASLSDPESVDYLGRAIVANPMLAPLSDEATVNIFGRMVYDAIAHRRLVVQLAAVGYVKDLSPGVRVSVRSFDASGELVTKFADFWLRRKTCVIDYAGLGGIPVTHYTLDSQWEGPLE